MKISRRGSVDPFIVMDVMEQARAAQAAGRDVIHMEVGQPATPAPRLARERLARALDSDALGYTVALGLPELREGIARLYKRRHGLDLDPARVVVTAGSSGAFLLAFLALFEIGDEVALGDPSYPSYRNIFKALGVRVRRIETRPETRYQPTPADMGDSDGLLVASPANPTGTMLALDELRALAQACAARGAAFISDEIYHGLTYERPAVSALEATDDVFVINSFSKYFSMTGWRIGWMVVPPSHLRAVERLAQNLFICPTHASQVAALGALEAEDELEANRAVYARNRALLLEELPRAGFRDIAPCDGAFYLYADVAHLTDDSRAFCARMLDEAGVAATPGLDFDPVRGARTVRFSFAGSEAQMREGARRLRAWLGAGGKAAR
ncbi:pyridoxal phosphate-dependent aminotransferase [Oceanicella actignis]|uniref:Aminotransferase n=1 Tax=Oceanicella actignis TaxID=1189325 RepID=A0A1M7TGD4_9RHOB|nr:aminotransferase class I/II-fold pyridoxal phosphate-dependent enzyme [Oceanicella actignis]SET60154.1 Aspartate/methionine/tyrosine aminotransferase [Oceanicella actignis]SHN69787.1 Aspartate/methionine/tyrosine aminotransferase [Oceanicella actignis]